MIEIDNEESILRTRPSNPFRLTVIIKIKMRRRGELNAIAIHVEYQRVVGGCEPLRIEDELARHRLEFGQSHVTGQCAERATLRNEHVIEVRHTGQTGYHVQSAICGGGNVMSDTRPI